MRGQYFFLSGVRKKRPTLRNNVVVDSNSQYTGILYYFFNENMVIICKI